MKNYLTIGLVNRRQLLMFFLEAVKPKGNYSMAIQSGLKGKFIKAYINKDILNQDNEDFLKFIDMAQINALYINIL
jgi:hypothetical protein